MLIRILTDNPGETFTRNIDSKFVDNFQTLLKSQRDSSVIQMAIETLSGLQKDKAHLNGVDKLLAMWNKLRKGYPPPRQNTLQPLPNPNRPPMLPHHSSHNSNRARLPAPDELAQRIAEARTSANLLVQFVSSASVEELIGSNTDLITEFVDRCKLAQDSMHRYMNCTDPMPDEDTFQTMIETNELLGAAVSKHQRALLAARRELGGFSPVVSPSVVNHPVLNTEERERQQWEEEQEAGGSRRLTEEEQLRRLNVTDEDVNDVAENPFADGHGGYGGFATNGHEPRDKGKQVFGAAAPPPLPPPPPQPARPMIAELPVPPPQQQQAAPYWNHTNDYGFPQPQPTNFLPQPPPPPPAATKPRRPPPPSETETEILSNAYRPMPQQQPQDDYIPPPISRVELPDTPSRKQPTTVPFEDDTWNSTRSHWSAVSNSARQPQSQPPHTNYQNHGYSSNINTAPNGTSAVMHGAIDTGENAYTAPSRNTPQRRAPGVPLTREDLDAVESASSGSDIEKEGNGESRRVSARRPVGGWGEESYVHNSGRNRRIRDV